MPVRSISTVRHGRTVEVKASALAGSWQQQETLSYTALPLRFRTDESRVLGSYAERSVAVYSCVAARANNLRTVPLRFWKEENGIKRPVTSGPLVQAWKKVNPFWSGVRFMDAIEQSLCYYGNAYFVVDRTDRRVPTFWWVHPGKIKPIRGAHYIEGYRFEDFETGTRIHFRPDEIVHIPYFFVENEWEGLSPLTAARNGIEASIDAMIANRKFFRNGMHIAGIVSPKEEGDRFTKQQVKDLEKDLRERFNGSDQAHRLAVLSSAVDIKPWGVAPKDAEFMGLAQWTLADVCRVYGVPLSIAQEVERSAYKNIGTEMKGFWSLCLVPEGKFIASELTEKLLPLFPDEADYAEFDFSGVRELQEDQTQIVLQMRTLHEMQVPLNPLLREYMPHLIPEGTDGYPWGDEPRELPGITGLGSGAPLEAPKDAEGRLTLPATWKSATVPVDPAWRDTPRGKAYLGALEGPQTPADDGSPLAALERASKLISAAKADEQAFPAYDSAEHQAIMAAFEESIAPVEQQAQREIAALFGEQSADIAERLKQQSLPKGKAAQAEDEESAKEEAMLLALLLLLSAYPANQWDTWTATIDTRLRGILDAAYRLGAESAYRELGITPVVDPGTAGQAWMQQRAGRSARQINETTWNAVRQSVASGILAGESIDDIVQRVTTAMTRRAGADAAMIASTEVFTAYGEGSTRAYELSGVVKAIGWMTRLDAKVRDAHRRIHGQRIKPGEYFVIPSGAYKGYRARGPGQFGITELDARCRCRPYAAKRTDQQGAAT